MTLCTLESKADEPGVHEAAAALGVALVFLPLDALKAGYERWRVANRLVQAAPFQNGHSYGNIIGRNAEAFAAHPEYYALLENGERDSQRAVAARKLCYSNPGLIELVANDRLRLLEESRRQLSSTSMMAERTSSRSTPRRFEISAASSSAC